MNLFSRAANSLGLIWPIVAAAATLVGLGLLGIARSEELSSRPAAYAAQQGTWAIVAGVALATAAVPHVRLWARLSYAAYALALVLLACTYAFPAVNGAHRWIRLGGLSLQPSELAKLAFIVATARYLACRDASRSSKVLAGALTLAAAPMLLVLREPNLGTALVFLPLTLCMSYAAGARLADLAKVMLFLLLLSPMVWSQMSREQRSRITALAEQNAPGERPTADGYHLHQAKQMLALGAEWGSLIAGEPADDPAAYHLPEDHTDFVFAVVCERFGWLGACTTLSAYLVLVCAATHIAARARDTFARLSAFGVATLFAIEALVNTAMTVGLAPVTGTGLPLVSYGGSSLVAHALALGLVVNVALRGSPALPVSPLNLARRRWTKVRSRRNLTF